MPTLRGRQPSLIQEAAADPYLSVAEAIVVLNDVLEVQFPQLLFRGEISQIQVAQSGHVYYTVKDQSAQIACVMWAGMARTLTFKPQTGTKVRCHGRPNIYSGSGRFQIVVSKMILDGEGELQRKFLELKAKLEQDGFFSAERKRPLPFLPKAVGIVTSKTGAVIHDIMVKLRERFPAMPVYLADTRVQGEGAALEIAGAIRALDKANLVDVIIVARGGGSLEDLWAFNEESVIKAVFACSVPVISGVGHEVDVTLCDLVADVRAPTPTAAAEMVVPHRDELQARVVELERRLKDTGRWFLPKEQRLDDLSMRLETCASSVLREARLRLAGAEARLTTIQPDRVVVLLRSKLDILVGRCVAAGLPQQQRRERLVAGLSDRLKATLTHSHLAHHRDTISAMERRLQFSVERMLERARAEITASERRLEAISPQGVLDRGYAVVRVGDRYVNTIEQVQVGNAVQVTLCDGALMATVDGVLDT